MRNLLLFIALFTASAVAQISFSSGAGGQPRGAVYRSGAGITDPVATYKPEPQYAGEALKAAVQGSVLLEVVVDETGKLLSAKVLRPLLPMELRLNEKAIESVIRWKFKPGLKDGKAVAVATPIEIAFRLPDAPPAKQ